MNAVFAAELTAAASVLPGAPPLDVATFELQYLDSTTGKPVLASAALSEAALADAVLRSKALLLSDRPVAQLIAQQGAAGVCGDGYGNGGDGEVAALPLRASKARKQLSGRRCRQLSWSARGRKLLTLSSGSGDGGGEMEIGAFIGATDLEAAADDEKGACAAAGAHGCRETPASG